MCGIREPDLKKTPTLIFDLTIPVLRGIIALFVTNVPRYQDNSAPINRCRRKKMAKAVTKSISEGSKITVERVQTGVRIEKRMLKVLKALAEYLDISLGDLLEGIVLHAFESKPVFSEDTLQRIEALKQVYDMDYDASASHQFIERASHQN
jgi:hypothetical protein